MKMVVKTSRYRLVPVFACFFALVMRMTGWLKRRSRFACAKEAVLWRKNLAYGMIMELKYGINFPDNGISCVKLP